MANYTQTKEENYINFFSKLSNKVDIDFNYFIDIENNIDFESIADTLIDNDALTDEVIYCSTAISFLAENDASLLKSLNLAYELGYEVHNINSELLATLLSSEDLRNDFYGLETEITEFLNDLNL